MDFKWKNVKEQRKEKERLKERMTVGITGISFIDEKNKCLINSADRWDFWGRKRVIQKVYKMCIKTEDMNKIDGKMRAQKRTCTHFRKVS